MFKTKKALAFLLAITLVFSIFIAGCDNGDTNDTDSDTESTDSGEKDGEKVVVNVAGGAVGQEYELTVEAAEMYMEKNPDVEVNVVKTPDSSTERLQLYLQNFEAQSSDIDVMQIDVIWPGDLAEHLLDLNEYGGKEVAGDHFDALIENNTLDGKLLAIPWFTDAPVLYYRTDLLEKYELEVPTTWDELEEAAKTIQEGERKENADFTGFVFQGNAYEGLTCDALEWINSNGGGRIINDDREITINNEKAIEIVEKTAGWVGTIAPEGVVGFDEEASRAVWHAGNAAFMRNWPYAYALSNEDDSSVKGKFDVTTLPAGDSGSSAATLGGWELAVSKYTKNPEVAADVALFLASEEVQKLRAVKGSMNPTIKSLYEDEEVLEASPFASKLYDVFTNAVARPSTVTAPNYNEVSTKFFTAVHSVLTGEEDAKTAFEVLELDLQDITDYEIGDPK